MRSKQRPPGYFRRLIHFTILCLLGALILLQFGVIPVLSARGYSHPKRLAVCCRTPADLGLAYEEIQLTSRDGISLRGWFIPASTSPGISTAAGSSIAAIILLHPIASNRLAMLDMAGGLAAHGYATLLLDLRAHGESGGDLLPYGGPETADVDAAVAYLQARPEIDPQRIAVLGWSLGAQVGILSAAGNPAIRAVIADGPGATAFEDWPPPRTFIDYVYVPMDWVYYQAMPWYTGVWKPLSILDAVGQIAPRHLLLICSERELWGVERFFAAAGEPKQIWAIPGVGHIAGFRTYPQEYIAKITGFLGDALKPGE